jgi:hypothetical protein
MYGLACIHLSTQSFSLSMHTYYLLWFFLFDLQPSSLTLSVNAESPLIGKMLLLIARKNKRVDDLSDNAVEIIRVTDELDIVKEYHVNGNNYTPLKVCVFSFPIVIVHSLLGPEFV